MSESQLGLEEKVAVITGSANGIGRASALELARAGTHVVVSDLTGERAESEKVADQVRSLGGEALVVDADVSRERDVESLVQQALERFGRIDVGVNNAGRTGRPPAGEGARRFHSPTSLEAGLDYWNEMLEVGLTSVYLGSRAFARSMVEREIRGSIINISGHAGMRASVGLAPYGAAKAGVIHLTKTLGAELAPHGIRVNSVAPGATDTRALRGYFATPERRARAAAGVPMGRIGTPEDIAKVVVLLASDLAGWVTGQTLSADGGQSIAGSGGPDRN
jgi:3-oxoacyl-[acyl-carrier protein] reductase